MYLVQGYEHPLDTNNSSNLNFKDGKCFSKIHASLKEELIQQASYDHPNIEDDNAMLYKLLDTTTKSTSYNSTIQTFVENKDGVGSYNALYKDYSGKAKWEKQYAALVWGSQIENGKVPDLLRWLLMPQSTETIINGWSGQQLMLVSRYQLHDKDIFLWLILSIVPIQMCLLIFQQSSLIQTVWVQILRRQRST